MARLHYGWHALSASEGRAEAPVVRTSFEVSGRAVPALISTLFLILLCWFLFFYRLGARDLWSSHEGRAAQDAQTILDDGRWGLLRLYDRQVELQKPPLYYWLIAAAARLRGGPVDAWAVRLPSALSALVCAVAVAAVGWSSGRRREGLVAAVLLLTALHFTWLARVGRIDMPLTA